MTIRINSLGHNIKQCAVIITVIAIPTRGEVLRHPPRTAIKAETRLVTSQIVPKHASPGQKAATKTEVIGTETEIAQEIGSVIETGITEDKMKGVMMIGRVVKIAVEDAADHATTAEVQAKRDLLQIAAISIETNGVTAMKSAKPAILSAKKKKVRASVKLIVK